MENKISCEGRVKPSTLPPGIKRVKLDELDKELSGRWVWEGVEEMFKGREVMGVGECWYMRRRHQQWP